MSPRDSDPLSGLTEEESNAVLDGMDEYIRAVKAGLRQNSNQIEQNSFHSEFIRRSRLAIQKGERYKIKQISAEMQRRGYVPRALSNEDLREVNRIREEEE
jgi:hypothetical protein